MRNIKNQRFILGLLMGNTPDERRQIAVMASALPVEPVKVMPDIDQKISPSATPEELAGSAVTQCVRILASSHPGAVTPVFGQIADSIKNRGPIVLAQGDPSNFTSPTEAGSQYLLELAKQEGDLNDDDIETLSQLLTGDISDEEMSELMEGDLFGKLKEKLKNIGEKIKKSPIAKLAAAAINPAFATTLLAKKAANVIKGKNVPPKQVAIVSTPQGTAVVKPKVAITKDKAGVIYSAPGQVIGKGTYPTKTTVSDAALTVLRNPGSAQMVPIPAMAANDLMKFATGDAVEKAAKQLTEIAQTTLKRMDEDRKAIENTNLSYARLSTAVQALTAPDDVAATLFASPIDLSSKSGLQVSLLPHMQVATHSAVKEALANMSNSVRSFFQGDVLLDEGEPNQHGTSDLDESKHGVLDLDDPKALAYLGGDIPMDEDLEAGTFLTQGDMQLPPNDISPDEPDQLEGDILLSPEELDLVTKRLEKLDQESVEVSGFKVSGGFVDEALAKLLDTTSNAISGGFKMGGKVWSNLSPKSKIILGAVGTLGLGYLGSRVIGNFTRMRPLVISQSSGPGGPVPNQMQSQPVWGIPSSYPQSPIISGSNPGGYNNFDPFSSSMMTMGDVADSDVIAMDPRLPRADMIWGLELIAARAHDGWTRVGPLQGDIAHADGPIVYPNFYLDDHGSIHPGAAGYIAHGVDPSKTDKTEGIITDIAKAAIGVGKWLFKKNKKGKTNVGSIIDGVKKAGGVIGKLFGKKKKGGEGASSDDSNHEVAPSTSLTPPSPASVGLASGPATSLNPTPLALIPEIRSARTVIPSSGPYDSLALTGDYIPGLPHNHLNLAYSENELSFKRIIEKLKDRIISPFWHEDWLWAGSADVPTVVESTGRVLPIFPDPVYHDRRKDGSFIWMGPIVSRSDVRSLGKAVGFSADKGDTDDLIKILRMAYRYEDSFFIPSSSRLSKHALAPIMEDSKGKRWIGHPSMFIQITDANGRPTDLIVGDIGAVNWDDVEDDGKTEGWIGAALTAASLIPWGKVVRSAKPAFKKAAGWVKNKVGSWLGFGVQGDAAQKMAAGIANKAKSVAHASDVTGTVVNNYYMIADSMKKTGRLSKALKLMGVAGITIGGLSWYNRHKDKEMMDKVKEALGDKFARYEELMILKEKGKLSEEQEGELAILIARVEEQVGEGADLPSFNPDDPEAQTDSSIPALPGSSPSPGGGVQVNTETVNPGSSIPGEESVPPPTDQSIGQGDGIMSALATLAPWLTAVGAGGVVGALIAKLTGRNSQGTIPGMPPADPNAMAYAGGMGYPVSNTGMPMMMPVKLVGDVESDDDDAFIPVDPLSGKTLLP